MKRRTFYKGCVVVGYGLGLLLLLGGNTTWTARVTEDFLQHQADAHPLKPFHSITVPEKGVTIHLDNHADILVEMTGKKATRSFHMVIHAIGQPDFEHSRNGEFYFKPSEVKIAEFTYIGATPTDLLDTVRNRYVKSEKIKNLLADAAPHVETWIREAAEKTAVLALQHIPVYRLKDHGPGFYLGGALSDMHIEGNELVLTFSGWAILKLVMIGLGVLMLTVMFTIFMICNPETGMLVAAGIIAAGM